MTFLGIIGYLDMSTTTSMEQPSINIDEETIKKINNEMLTSALITPDFLYIDLRLLKDYNIGCLLSFLKERQKSISAEEYQSLYNQILSSLDEYNQRKFDDINYYFPFMNVDNETFKKRLHDERCASFIFHHSPLTKFMNVLKSQIFVNVNHSAVKGKHDPIEITFNTYPLKLNTQDKSSIGTYISRLLGVNVHVLYLDINNLESVDFTKIDEFYLYYFKEFIETETVRNDFTNLKYLNKKLFVAKLLGNTHTDQKAILQDEHIIRTRMDICSNFQFLPAHIFSTVPMNDKEFVTDG